MSRNYVPEELKLISQEEIIPEDELYVVEAIIDHRGEPGNREYLVRWKNYTKEDDSWIPPAIFTDPEMINIYWRRLGVKPTKRQLEREKILYSPPKPYKRSSTLNQIMDMPDIGNLQIEGSNRKRSRKNSTSNTLRRSKRGRKSS